jgi:hypothetical protein
MHTIGKILGENPKFTCTLRTNAGTGALKIILTTTRMVVLTNTDVPIVMAGKNKNITLKVIN